MVEDKATEQRAKVRSGAREIHYVHITCDVYMIVDYMFLPCGRWMRLGNRKGWQQGFQLCGY